MIKCRFCGGDIKDSEIFCSNCGYDPKLDMVNLNFQSNGKAPKKAFKESKQRVEGSGVSQGVKNFAFLGLLIIVFSIFYHYSFNVEAVLSDAKSFISRLTKGKLDFLKFGKKDNSKEGQTTKWVDINSFKPTGKFIKSKTLNIEGILYDPQAKSAVIINGEILSEGQSLNEVTIRKINKNSVEVLVGGQIKTLEVNQSLNPSSR